jgi:PAS domain S-box-containing protein
MEAAYRERVLLVDDEPQVLVALEDVLADQFTVLKTSSAEAALDTMRRDRDIAVVVTDQRMPFMSGDELLAKLRDWSDATRILLTGFADLSAVIRAINDGKIFAYVSKPWNADDLRLKVLKAAEHFRLARQLTKERALLDSILEHMGDGVVVVSRDERFLLFNPQAERLLGAGARAIPSATWAETYGLFLPDRMTLVPVEGNPLLRAAKGERVSDEEIFVRNGVVSGASVLVKGTPLFDEAGDVVGGICVLRDVTEQRLLEQELQQAQKMEAIGRLAGGVAHDFNNVLTIISSYAAVLGQEFEAGDPRTEDVQQILTASQRAASLTGQLLAFSRRTIVQPRVVDLNEIVSGVEKMVRRILREDVDLRTVLAESLGRVRADIGQIEQVLLNLVVNASDAMPTGGKLTIETQNVALRSGSVPAHPGIGPGEFVMLAVSDTGVGIDRQTQSRIFEPFFTTKELGKGTGLGLATVYGIVQQSGGRIVVYSELGQGTSMKIYLPRVDAPVDVAIPSPSSDHPPAPGTTILVVEDDKALREITVRVLRAHGYVVREAASAAEVMDLVEDLGGTELLLTDVIMPGTSGPKLAAALSARHPNLRVLFMSGYAGGALEHQDASLQGIPFLEKPFTPDILVDKVREVLTSERAAVTA